MFGSKLITTPLRKATKVVVYTAVPISGPLKAATMGTRRGNLSRKEIRQQTELLKQQNAMLAQQGNAMLAAQQQQNAMLAHQQDDILEEKYGLEEPPVVQIVTPDGKWASLDQGATWQQR